MVHGDDVLIRFWITVQRETDVPSSTYSPLGYGVTAFDRDDAIAVLRDRVFGGRIPQVESVAEDVDVSTLDEGHVRPNMETPAFRGVWFPMGYAGAGR